MTATTRTTSTRVTNAQIASKLDSLTEVMGQLVLTLTANLAGTHATSGAVVEITSAPSARKAAPRKAASKAAAKGKAAKKADPQAAAKRAEQAKAWAEHKEIRSLVNKAYAAAGVKFQAGTLDRFLDKAAVQAMLAQIAPSRKAEAKAFVAKMVAKAAESA